MPKNWSQIYLLNPWQMSENWSICRFASSPIRPPPPAPSWPISTTLKQRANLKCFAVRFCLLNFVGVNIAKEEKGVMHGKRAVEYCVCFLLVGDGQVYNIHGDSLVNLLTDNHFSRISVHAMFKILLLLGSPAMMVYRRQRFIR